MKPKLHKYMLLERIKILRLFKKIIKEIEKNKINENNITDLIDRLDYLRKHDIVTDDYLDDIDVLLYVVSKCLMRSSGGWINLSMHDLRNRNSYNKMKDLVDELDANSFIHHKIISLGGNISFELTHKDRFRKYITVKLNNMLDPLKIRFHKI